MEIEDITKNIEQILVCPDLSKINSDNNKVYQKK